jgi:lipopolysaccharide export system permease protein
MFIKRLDLYLFKELARSTLVGSLVAVVVLLGLQILRLSDLIIKFDLDATSVFKMLTGLALSFTPLVLPIAFLFALLMAFGRMSADREFVASLAMGFSPRRLLHPCYLVGSLVMLLTLWTGFSLGPLGNRRFEVSIDEAFKRRVTSSLRSGTFSEGFLDMIVFVDRVDPLTQALERVFIHDERSFSDQVSISAKRGQWIQSEEEGLGILKLHDGVVVSQDSDKRIVRRVNFDEYNIYADFSRQTGSSRQSPPSLGLGQLLQRRQEAQIHREIDPRPIWIEIARRFSIAVACLFFVPLAFALSIDNRRTARSRAIFSGLAVLLIYWTLYFSLVTWVLKSPFKIFQQHELVSWIVIWIPNVIMIVATQWLLRLRSSLEIAMPPNALFRWLRRR